VTYPAFKAVADRAVLVEFGATIADDIHGQVVRLDRMLAATPLAGLVEAVPAYASLMVVFDPLATDHGQVTAALRALIAGPDLPRMPGGRHDIGVCYEGDLGPDLAQVAAARGISVEAVIAAHLAGDYRVYLYGFAPGYAYLAGTPPEIQMPRKPVAVRDVPAGRVIVAGPQCIVTTLKMPTGWWVLGASPNQILRGDPAKPFLFDVGDRVRFHRMGRAEYHAAGGR
jgi:inhibitor of KinA